LELNPFTVIISDRQKMSADNIGRLLSRHDEQSNNQQQIANEVNNVYCYLLN